ncbi:hypothetical protein [Leptospira santarosai]|uniref:hypothetical protein n=1 Tax=Leptospira santarosai TaxID=28183 RepID=UPI00095CBE7D|nr:hypothetical protein [Leptospira santarosai]MBW9232908.1 hypothetical protein [Leptospira santarosai]OLY63515.1 hypothetical protein BWD11_14335 [Leptospira santarosai serovar Grippotyphosa]ONF75979.1 hypothetical protein BWD12_19615 [Leptospira santarosai serovar Bananal]ONF87003.1 hypothetical protein BWD13_07320 [Leptospira santarosai serovar Grippotyphosa]
MIRTKGNEEIPKAIRKQLDTLLKTGGEGIDVGYLMYIQDKPERKYYPLVEASLRSKQIDQVIAGAYLAVSWKLKEFAPLLLLWEWKGEADRSVMQAVHTYLSDREKTLAEIKQGSPEMFGTVKIMHNIRNPDVLDWEILLSSFDLLLGVEGSQNFLSDLVFASVRMLESGTPSPEIKKELRKRLNRLDPDMPVDDSFLHEELLKRFRAFLL